MEFGICPECKTPVTKRRFKVTCENCAADLKQSGITMALQIMVIIIAGIVVLQVALNVIPQIVASRLAEQSDAIFWFSMKLCVGVNLAAWLINMCIGRFLVVYVKRDK